MWNSIGVGWLKCPDNCRIVWRGCCCMVGRSICWLTQTFCGLRTNGAIAFMSEMLRHGCLSQLCKYSVLYVVGDVLKWSTNDAFYLQIKDIFKTCIPLYSTEKFQTQTTMFVGRFDVFNISWIVIFIKVFLSHVF